MTVMAGTKPECLSCVPDIRHCKVHRQVYIYCCGASVIEAHSHK